MCLYRVKTWEFTRLAPNPIPPLSLGMSASHPSRLPSRFERLLAYPSSLPLVHADHHAHALVLPIAAPKREREAAPHPLSGFDPMEDPEGCLRRYHAVQLAVQQWADPAERATAQTGLESAEPLLLDFLSDQAEICTVYGDCETTELIKHGTPIGDMSISVASLLFVEDGGGGDGMMLSFWGDASLGRGAPLRFFRHAVEHAKRLVFYNAAFDLTLAARGDESTIRRWWRRTHDPYKLLRDAFGTSVRLKLDVLLRDNGLAPKTATGVEAVRMYADGRHDELERYNRVDVEALRSLVQLERIRLSNGRYTAVGTLGGRPVAARYPPGDPRSLVQGTPEWKLARAGLLTASVAGAALGVSGAFQSRDSVAAALHAQLHGLADPAGDGELDDDRRQAMQRGQQLEPVARRAYEWLFGVRVEQSGLHPHPRHPDALAASPDGIVLRSDGALSDLLVEIKVPRANTKGAGLTDAYLCQLQLAMACTQTRRADFVVLRELDNGRSARAWQLAVTRVDRDDALLEVMERQLMSFHAEAEQDDEPFPLDPVDAAQLRSALREAREEHVGAERVHEVHAGLV